MCGRVTQSLDAAELAKRYAIERQTLTVHLKPRYNASPRQELTIVREEYGTRLLTSMEWGFLASASTEPVFGTRPINARSETVHQKRMFASAFRERRCVVPVNGWYEWRREEDGKQPFWIRREGEDLVGLAAIWEGWTRDRYIESFAILTTNAAARIGHLHHRQPVILDEESIDVWLNDESPLDEVLAIAQRPAEGRFDISQVDRAMGNPDHTPSEVVEALAA